MFAVVCVSMKEDTSNARSSGPITSGPGPGVNPVSSMAHHLASAGDPLICEFLVPSYTSRAQIMDLCRHLGPSPAHVLEPRAVSGHRVCVLQQEKLFRLYRVTSLLQHPPLFNKELLLTSKVLQKGSGGATAESGVCLHRKHGNNLIEIQAELFTETLASRRFKASEKSYGIFFHGVFTFPE
ncbi:hypothetical protein MG293_011281 [Ovis ammon polii]|uniref:Uncharacterized protein n=1 Tax=Ovis ammon polii TaxID=230172 RepID=A0AAD4U760_OVIAM|nr:hypothetical protein MG293_011281 [Ovis ammon polii]